MVNITEVRAVRAQSSNRNRINQNASSVNANRAVVRRSKQPRVIQDSVTEPGSSDNENEENDELSGAHKYQNAHLIMTLAAWVKKPSVDHNLSEVLSEYRTAFNNSDNPNFVEAALVLQEAGKLYDKKVDMLFKSVLEAEHRIVKSFNIINMEELHKIEKKMRKRKLTQAIEQQLPKSKRRKKHHKWLQNPWLCQLLEKIRHIFRQHATGTSKEPDLTTDLFHISPDMLKPMEDKLMEQQKWHDPVVLKAWEERYRKDYEERYIPMEEYIYIPNLEQSKFIAYESPEKDQIVRWETLLMADHNFYIEKKFKWYEVYHNHKDPKTMMDTSVWDDAWYKHRMANLHAPTLFDLFDNYDKYDDTLAEKFLTEKLEEEYQAQLDAETLKEKTKRLCPYQLKVVAKPITEVVLQSILEQQRLRAESLDLLPEPVETPPQGDPVESINEETVEETVAVLVLSDLNADNQVMILPQTPEEIHEAPENVPALPEGSNSNVCLFDAEGALSIVNDEEVPQIANNEEVPLNANDEVLPIESVEGVVLMANDEEMPPILNDEEIPAIASVEEVALIENEDDPNETNESIVEEIGTNEEAQEIEAVLVDVVPIERRKSQRERKVAKADTDDEEDDNIENAPKRKKRFKLQITTTVNFVDYERFFCSNYTTEEREGIVVPLPSPPPLPEPEEEIELNTENIHTEPSNETEELLNTDNILTEPSNETEEVAPLNTEDILTEPANETEDVEDVVTPLNTDNIQTGEEEELTEEVASQSRIPPLPTGEILTPDKRRFDELQAIIAADREKKRWYYDWEAMIRARLQEQQKGPQFDIHEYGTNIVNQFPEDTPGKSIKFKDLVADQPKREVVRNFMAALHLATSMNLEVSGTTPGRLCNETLEFKLLSRELHHETLMSFEAPSELKGRGAKGRQRSSVKKQPATFVVEEIVDRSLSEPLAKKRRLPKWSTPVRVAEIISFKPALEQQQIMSQTPKSLIRIPKKSRHQTLLNNQAPIVLNHILSSTSTNYDSSSSISSERLFNETINNTRMNSLMQSSPSSSNQDSLIQSQSAKTPAKSVSFSDQDNGVRCTTTMVNTPSGFMFSHPEATSTPSSRTGRQSFDSGFSTDGYSTPGDTSPSFNDIRRRTIDDVLFEVDMLTAGPSTDYSTNYPASFDVEGGDGVGKRNPGDGVGNNRKRQLDFKMM